MTILEGIKEYNAPYNEDCLILVRIPEKKEKLDKKSHREYVIETTKGSITIALNPSPFFTTLVRYYYLFEGIKVGWLNKDVVTFGPVNMGFIKHPVTRDPKEYRIWDVFLSFGGFDPSNLHLCFCKRDHTGLYGAPDERLNGVVGRVIQGAHIIPLLRKTDSLLAYTPLTRQRKRILQLRPDELEQEIIIPGMEIYTYLSVTLYKDAKFSVDHFLSVINSGKFQIDQASSMYIKNVKYRNAKIPQENPIFRQRGTITVRNQGNDIGSVYIYKNDTSFSPSHNVIGCVDSKHLPLIINANPGTKLLVQTDPISLNFIGKTQKYASTHLTKYDISHKRVGDENDDAIIVEQRPKNTMDVWAEKTCVTLGLNSSKIVKCKFYYEKTPLSIKHFKRYANMLYYPIGKLQVLDNLKTLILFLPIEGESIEAIPRESEVEHVPAGAIGVTNALRRLTGSIGIRLEESDTYGPTGETFEGTNIIGQVISGLDVIRQLDTGDIVWLMEVQNDE